MKQLAIKSALDIDEEMQRQINLWGQQSHSPEEWYLILGEEFGEVGKAILEKKWAYENAANNYEEELIQVAAVAMSALQCVRRQKEEEEQQQFSCVAEYCEKGEH